MIVEEVREEDGASVEDDVKQNTENRVKENILDQTEGSNKGGDNDEKKKPDGGQLVLQTIAGFDEAIRYMDWTFEQCF